MVFLFFIASLQGNESYPLFYRFYEEKIQDSNVKSQIKSGNEKTCLSVNQRHRQQVNSVAEEVYSQHLFYSAFSASRSIEKDSQMLDRDDWQNDLDVYSFRLDKGDSFPADMRVIWLSVHGVGFALVCYYYENRLLAELILKVITRHLNDFCRIILQPNEFFTKPEKIQIVLNKFLPYGQLLFMNHRAIRQLERETEVAMKVKGVMS